MSTRTASSSLIARRLWARSVEAVGTTSDATAVAERMLGMTRGGLGRWIGAEGFRALFDRALRDTVPAHPVLRQLEFLWNDRGVVALVSDRAPAPEAIADAMVAVVVALVALLGAIVGEPMALRLVEQVGSSSPRTGVSTTLEGGPDA